MSQPPRDRDVASTSHLVSVCVAHGDRSSRDGVHVPQRPDVVVVPVRHEDRVETRGRVARSDEGEKGVRVSRGIDQGLRAGRRAGDQIGVVVHRADGELAHGAAEERADVGGPSDDDVRAVGWRVGLAHVAQHARPS